MLSPVLQHPVGQPQWRADDARHDPRDDDAGPAVGLRPPRHRLDGEDHGQEAVQGHEHQGVDAHEGRGDDQELHQLATGKGGNTFFCESEYY